MICRLVGVRIKELRLKAGLSQVEFAARIDMARTYFAEVETGKRNVSIRNLHKITNGFGITFKEFFDSDVFDVAYGRRFDGHDAERIDYAAAALPRQPR